MVNGSSLTHDIGRLSVLSQRCRVSTDISSSSKACCIDAGLLYLCALGMADRPWQQQHIIDDTPLSCRLAACIKQCIDTLGQCES